MRTFITSRDVEDCLVRGSREMKLDPDAVVTAEAEERAARLGVKLIRLPTPGERDISAGEPSPAGAGVPSPPPGGEPVRVTPRLDLLVRGGKVVVPGTGICQTDVWVKDGKVVGLASGGPEDAATVVPAEGCYVLPGIVDPHVHLGLFAPLEEELETESRSALLGGVTTVGCFFGGKSSYLPF
ncbi:MAG: hypothetical protein AB1816_21350, partial [Bacillota bacterium]